MTDKINIYKYMFVEEWIKYTCIFFTELKKSIAKKKEIIYIYKTN